MSDVSSTKSDLSLVQPKSFERIVLNVGGVKYETYRETLTAYPSTFLGSMFQKHNQDLVHPTNGNEYFFDRDGFIFRYILNYYRNGEITWPDEGSKFAVTRRELEHELDYFQIPFERPVSQSYVNRAAIATVDSFIDALEEIFYKMVANLGTTLKITFNYRQVPEITTTQKFEGEIKKILAPFASVDLNILEKYGLEIKVYFQSRIPELTLQFEEVKDSHGHYRGQILTMSVASTYDHEAVLRYSRLGRIKAHSRINTTK